MIDSFTGKYRFLSNFSPANVWFDEALYPTVEHAYQAAKTEKLLERAAIRDAKTPGEAKRLGQSITLRDNWDVIKIPIMVTLLREKFEILENKAKLLDTGNEELVEGNHWGDTFWGVCQGKGENHLGRLLMKIRTEMEDRAFGQPHFGH